MPESSCHIQGGILPSETDFQQKARNRTDFDKILVESINEAIAIVLGRKTSPELERHLQAFLGFSYDKIDNVEVLFSSLERAYGLFGSAVPKLVVKTMYAKAKVPFYEVAGTPMIQYVYDLKRNLASHNLLDTGKLPASKNPSQAPKPQQTQPVPEAT
jgi:hypothetical protein